jgi:hypothetical protein
LNKFNSNGGSLIKQNQQSQNGTRKEVAKDVTKSLNKTNQMVVAKTQNNILSSVGLETLISTKITMPKISVVRK